MKKSARTLVCILDSPRDDVSSAAIVKSPSVLILFPALFPLSLSVSLSVLQPSASRFSCSFRDGAKSVRRNGTVTSHRCHSANWQRLVARRYPRAQRRTKIRWRANHGGKSREPASQLAPRWQPTTSVVRRCCYPPFLRFDDSRPRTFPSQLATRCIPLLRGALTNPSLSILFFFFLWIWPEKALRAYIIGQLPRVYNILVNRMSQAVLPNCSSSVMPSRMPF